MKDWIDDLKATDSSLFNPKRLIILSYAMTMSPITQGALQKLSKLPWGTFTPHLKYLEKQDYIEIQEVLTRKGPRKEVSITFRGIQVYKEVLEMMKAFCNHNKL